MGCFGFFISIHALLAESDEPITHLRLKILISIHALLAESDAQFIGADAYLAENISIHALLAESDAVRWAFEDWYIDFYPRSPCGERHKSVETITVNFTFLSTLSLRRATGSAKRYQAYFDISIHALLAESDQTILYVHHRSNQDFYPRSPCGERQAA